MTRRFAALVAGALGVLGAACTCGPPAPGVFRDQFLFFANDGAVLALGVVRHTSGTGEAKGWLGVDGAWATPVYDRFPIAPRRAADLPASIRAWSTARPGAVQASLSTDEAGAHLRLRTKSARLWLDAEAPVPIGSTRDREGTSTYSVSRAHLTAAGRDRDGWLVTETTPPDAPLRPHVDYGDFVLVAAALPSGAVVVAKRSLGRRGYDVALRGVAHAIEKTRKVQIDVVGGTVSVRGGQELEPLAVGLTIRDRARSEGTAPDGRRVVYETLLLGGEWTGVAFRIR